MHKERKHKWAKEVNILPIIYVPLSAKKFFTSSALNDSEKSDD